MRLPSRAAAVMAAAATLPLAGAAVGSPSGALPRSTLAVQRAGQWETFWRSDRGPTRWTAAPRLTEAIEWRPGQPGVSWAELALAGSGEARRTRVILVRLDPARVRFELANGASPGGLDATWTVGSAPPEAVAALNAGQFSGGAEWGWVVHGGEEYREPGRGPLAVAIVVDSAGTVRFLNDDSVADRRVRGTTGRPAGVVEGFQSYPILLREGNVPDALLAPGPFIDLAHRDARLALGQLPDGTLLVALTRFDALGGALGGIPFGFTIPEMAALMGALGCRNAVALDGGVSAQLMVRDDAGHGHEWRGLRRVPLALLALPRAPAP